LPEGRLRHPRGGTCPGAKVHHLKECFGLFVPDGDSTMFTEVAKSTAKIYNECGFDMIYLDALDGSDILAGGEHAWHLRRKVRFRAVPASRQTGHL